MTTSKKHNVPALRFPEFRDDWEKTTISLVANKITDGTHDTPKQTKEGVPYLTAIHVKDGVIDFKNCYFLPKEVHDQIYKRCNPQTGDLLMVNIGAGVATSALVHVDYEFSLKNVALIKPNHKKIVPEFFEQTQRMNSSKLRHRLTSGGAQSFLSLKQIGKLKLSITNLQEQQKIAAFLSAVDTKIEQLDKKKALLEQYKKSMMQKLFNQEFRFKDIKGNDYPDWEEKKVSELFIVTRGNVLAVNKMKSEADDKFFYPVYSSQTRDNGLTGFYTDYLYENAITWTTDGANAGEVKFRKEKFYCTNVCGVLLSDKGNANQCISEMLNKVTRKYVSYVGNPKLMNNVMASIKIKFPTVAEQQKIADFLSAIDKKIELVSIELEQARTFKKGLLQQMFV